MRWATGSTSHSALLLKLPTTTTSPSKTIEVNHSIRILGFLHIPLAEYSSFCGAALGVILLFPRLDQSVTRWRLATLMESSRCCESLSHTCTRVLQAVLIAVGSLSVCTYFFGGLLIELSVEIAVREVKERNFKEWRREAKSEDENAGTTSFENRSCSRLSLIWGTGRDLRDMLVLMENSQNGH